MSAIASKQFSLQWRDILRGLIMAIISAVITVIYESAQAGSLNFKDFDWTNILTVAITAGSGYLLKNFFEPPKVIIKAENNEDAELQKTQLP